MLSFFRRIRRQLANDNKPLKYMRYAIGEIVLVVIGILIALQINNWNQDRLERQKESKILVELERDLASNASIIKFQIDQERDFTNEALLLIEHFNNKKPFNDTIGLYLNHVSWIERIQFTSSAYESLKSVGINLISSDSIRADITYIFGTEFPQKTMWIRDAGINNANLSHHFYYKYFERIKVGNEGVFIPTDYEGALKDQEFINNLSGRRSIKSVFVLELEKLLAKIEKARGRIKDELETFD